MGLNPPHNRDVPEDIASFSIIMLNFVHSRGSSLRTNIMRTWGVRLSMSESSSTPRVHIRYAVSLCMLKRSVLVVPTTLPSLSQDPNYWEHRYETQSCSFDWFYGFTACRLLLRTLINRKKVVLQIGCGNSTLQEGMANDGYTIVNVS